jgi:modulator of FtsH protease HflK
MLSNNKLQSSQDPWNNKHREQLPDLEDLFRNLKAKIFRYTKQPNDGNSNNNVPFIGLFLSILVVILIVWSSLGFYVINERERGVVLRFGKYTQTLQPGLQWQPYWIDKVLKINVTQIRELHSHGFMLTEDENIVEVTLKVQYFINNPKFYLLNLRSPKNSLSHATDSVIRHEVGGATMDYVLTDGRAQLATDVMLRLQEYADNYSSGVKISKVNIENTQAPKQVQSAFDDVIKAREDKERYQNQAKAYANSIIPEARGKAKRQLAEAQAYKAKVIANSTGEAQRFKQLVNEYKKSPQVTRDRLYIDAVEEVLSNTSKVLISLKSGNSMMYLPLDKIIKNHSRADLQDNLDSETGYASPSSTHSLPRRTK